MQQRRTFSEKFKRETVKFVRQPGASKAGISRDLEIRANFPERWCRELAEVKTERDILKKSAWQLLGRLQVTYRFIARHRTVWPTRTMCRVLGVSTSGFMSDSSVQKVFVSKPKPRSF